MYLIARFTNSLKSKRSFILDVYYIKTKKI
jgi:hypothetical protein